MLKVLWTLVLSAALSFCFLSEANAARLKKSEFISTGLTTKNERVFFLRYYEAKAWHVKQIIQNSNGWLDTTSSQIVASSSAAEKLHLKMENEFSRKHGRAVAPVKTLREDATLRSEVANEVLWPVTESWSWQWEQKYAQWLMENMNSEFYTKYQFATDCADVAYSARWIFARVHGLPMANRLANGTLFTNHSVRESWKNLPTAPEWYKDRRFLAALNYLMDYTYTHTLVRDSYPVAINPQNFIPGVHHLDIHSTSGHTQLVHRVDIESPAAIPFYVIQSTVPRAVRQLNEGLFWGSERSSKESGGFLRIRWASLQAGQFVLQDSEKMPGYSLEQYEPGFIREQGRPLSIEVMLRLKPKLRFFEHVENGIRRLKKPPSLHAWASLKKALRIVEMVNVHPEAQVKKLGALHREITKSPFYLTKFIWSRKCEFQTSI